MGTPSASNRLDMSIASSFSKITSGQIPLSIHTSHKSAASAGPPSARQLLSTMATLRFINYRSSKRHLLASLTSSRRDHLSNTQTLLGLIGVATQSAAQ